MDDIVLRGMAKWPNVPAVYGWLSLSRRGQWRLKGEPVVNPAITAFFGRNYGHDAQGRWLMQNGPQRVFVTLEYTPLVFRAVSSSAEPLRLMSHHRAAATIIRAAYIDDAGAVLMDTNLGIGLLHDADLEQMVSRFRLADGAPPDDAALTNVLDGLPDHVPGTLSLDNGAQVIPVHPIRAAEVSARFGFVAHPVPPAGQEDCY